MTIYLPNYTRGGYASVPHPTRGGQASIPLPKGEGSLKNNTTDIPAPLLPLGDEGCLRKNAPINLRSKLTKKDVPSERLKN